MKFHCILIFYTTAIDIISVLVLLHHAAVGHIADASYVLATSILRVNDRGSVHLLNVGNIVHNHAMKQHKTGINTNI
jgi:hypothetical protein